jgi:uncharacterized protein YbbK (DUF523 family)
LDNLQQFAEVNVSVKISKCPDCQAGLQRPRPKLGFSIKTTKRTEDVNMDENSKNVQLKGCSVKNTTIYSITTQRGGSHKKKCAR